MTFATALLTVAALTRPHPGSDRKTENDPVQMLPANASPRQILEALVGFDTTSNKPNRPLIDWCAEWLRQSGIEPLVVPHGDGQKAGLFAHVGPQVEGGVLLSGHTDVVPVEGQDWSSDPFTLSERDGRLFGRGTADMKGFDALALWAMARAAKQGVTRPLQIVLSRDEEIGCLGAPEVIEAVKAAGLPFASCVIVGEPSQMQVVTGHKGYLGHHVKVRGFEIHSALMHEGVSAVMEAARVINWAHECNQASAASQPSDMASLFVPPWTTLHIGTVHGGTAENITALECDFVVEMRPVPGDDGEAWQQRFFDKVAEIEADMQAVRPETGFDIDDGLWVPPLEPEVDGEAEALARRLTGDNGTHVVAYASEGGHFQRAGCSAVICGPGNIAQAHQPDEFILLSELTRGQTFLEDLIATLQN